MNLFRSFFKERTVLGFYLPFVGSLLSLFIGFFYLGFSSSRFYSAFSGPFFIAGGALFLILSLFPLTSRFASFPLFGFVFAGFLTMIKDGYIYFSEVFYGGFSIAALFKMDPFFLYPLLGSIVVMILSEFGIYKPSRKKKESLVAKEAN